YRDGLPDGAAARLHQEVTPGATGNRHSTQPAAAITARQEMREMREMNRHIGSNIDELLEEDGLREEVVAAAMKRVIAWQLAEAMKARHSSKTEMARRMHTSRMVVNRLLDVQDTSVTLATLARASVAVGIPMRIELDTQPG